MSLTFPTTALKKPSGLTAIPSGFKRPAFGTLYGFDATSSGGDGGDDVDEGLVNDYSLSLDGTNDYVDCGNNSSLEPDNITISAWVKAEGTLDYYNYVLEKYGASVGSIILRTQSAGKYNVLMSFTGAGASSISQDSASTFNLKTWHHVVLTYDRSYIKLYVDGIEEASVAETRVINYTPHGTHGSKFEIGQSQHGGDYQGFIDEVSLFNSALSSSDITAMYNDGTPVDLGTDGLNLGPVSWWRMGDNNSGTGLTVTDMGSGGNDGTLANNAVFTPDAPLTLPAITDTFSLDFNGTDERLSLGNLSYLSSATVATLSIWFKTTADDANIFSSYATGAGTADNECFQVYVHSNNTLRFMVGTGSNYSQIQTVEATFNDGNWHHGVFCYDGANNSLKIYVDGNARTAYASGGTTAPSALVANAGDGATVSSLAHGDSGHYLASTIDEVAFFDSVLTVTAIDAIYNGGAPTDISSLNPVGWWRMGDGGTWGTNWTIPDASTNSNAGTTVNMVEADRVTDVPS